MSDHQVATATLLDALPDKTVLGAPPARVTGLAYDSRKATPGSLFVAIPGF
jgi:UDP-N-acetylmuramyl pentapeptide synthase